MNNLETQIRERLTKLAYKRSRPYCSGCNEVAATGRCLKCGSDDLQRYTAEEGPGWGVDWVIEALIRENLKPIDADDAFESSIRECYPETTKIAWLEYDTVSAAKELDPVSWQMAVDEWVSSEESEGQLVTFDFGSKYYATPDVETFLDEQDFDELEVALETAG